MTNSSTRPAKVWLHGNMPPNVDHERFANRRRQDADDVARVADDVLSGEEVDHLAEELHLVAPSLLALPLSGAQVAAFPTDFDDDRQRREIEVHPGDVRAVTAVGALHRWSR